MPTVVLDDEESYEQTCRRNRQEKRHPVAVGQALQHENPQEAKGKSCVQYLKNASLQIWLCVRRQYLRPSSLVRIQHFIVSLMSSKSTVQALSS
jgi:hypothetical protein